MIPEEEKIVYTYIFWGMKLYYCRLHKNKRRAICDL
jgi:hypothetical protein